MRKKKKSKRIALQLSQDHYNELEREAETSGTDSISAVVRQAIVFYLSANTTKSNQSRKNENIEA